MAEENVVPEGEGTPEGEAKAEKTITESQLKAILRSANEKYDRVAAELAEIKAAKPAAAPAAQQDKRYSRAELNAAVTQGQVTQEQADTLWEKQLTQDVTEKVRKDVLGAVSANTRQEQVTRDLADYKALAPEILETESDKRKAIAEEFRYQVATLGRPQTLETELAAIRAVLGPLDKLKVARSARRGDEHHEETGGGGESRSRGGAKSVVDTLTAREKDYYDSKIKSGMYKDWKAVEAELAYARPDVRRKAGARV